MKDKDAIYRKRILFVFTFAIGFASSALGLLISFVLAKLSLFNAFDYFMSLPLFIQIPFLLSYSCLWLMLFYVLYKELS